MNKLIPAAVERFFRKKLSRAELEAPSVLTMTTASSTRRSRSLGKGSIQMKEIPVVNSNGVDGTRKDSSSIKKKSSFDAVVAAAAGGGADSAQTNV
jgi:hypothetical protein